ncbi:unnamed protein product [Triticum turgidum subsp. durum]|uniref:DUF642 domain-containing protein n=1 Tax=Triticum turgidum subsp. durum TaxID=4567 RepID=A0A9R0WS32_TRITD|nr:unnamed protein product [Triticum turgidum subsp. durum]
MAVVVVAPLNIAFLLQIFNCRNHHPSISGTGGTLEPGETMLNGALFLLVCAAARAAASGGDGPLLNGNFEYAPNRSQMNGSRVMAANAIPYWKVTGFVEYIESGARQGDMVLTVPEGRHAVQLGTDSSIRQQLSVTRGKLKVSVVPGDDVVADELPVQTVYTSSGWDSYSWAFKAKQGVVSFIIHHGDDHAEDPACGPVIDCVAIRALNPPRATRNNMLINGDFEEGPYITPGSPWGVLVPPMDEDDTSPLPGWMVMSYSKVVNSGYHTTSDGSGTLCGPVIDDVSLVCISRPHARRLLR